MGSGSTPTDAVDPGEFDGRAEGEAGLEEYQEQSVSNSRGGVSKSDVREVDSYQPSSPDAIDVDAPTPKEFAEQAFTERSRARRIRAGVDGHESVPVQDTSRLVGSWKSFNRDDVVRSEPLDEEGTKTGRTSKWMDKYELEPVDDRAATEAYVTNYNHDDMDHQYSPKPEHAQSQMAVQAGLDAMGVRSPRHVYDIAEDQVISESVSHGDYEAKQLMMAPEEWAAKVDPEQMKEVFAANAIMGNGDLSPDNVMIGEDGAIIPFDYDYTLAKDQLIEMEASAQHDVNVSIESIAARTGGEFELDASEVFDRAEELATQLKESGMADRVAEAAREYDTFFREDPASVERNAALDRANPETGEVYKAPNKYISERVRYHVDSWSA